MSSGSEKARSNVKGALILLFASTIWGTSFVAQSQGMERIEAFTFNGIRTLMGAGVLLIYLFLRRTLFGRGLDDDERAARRAKTVRSVKSGLIVGVLLFIASNLQQFAFNDTTAGKIAFITALYMFFVPLFGLVIGKRPNPLVWICVSVGFIGLYFLSIDPAEPWNINRGDFLALLCAIAYAVHILTVEHFAADTDGITLSFTQFTVSGVVSCLMMFLFESPNLTDINAVIFPLLYSGVMSCGIAFTLQVIGQKYAEATVASLAMCMESVFGVISAAIILGDRMSGRETLGCALMFTAIVFSQVSDLVWSRIRHAGAGSGT
ncbi:MAG: DMT family transporter [Clostridia bacterium]|nr:DMT family transporter [Clostridia bacterium]